jgi:type IV fimbrial biogenesis protein FimT
MRASRGFTLPEILVVVTILGVLLAVAAPSFQDASVNSKVSDNATRLAASASLARGEAIKRNGMVVLCKSADGASCATAGGWEQGWLVFHDVNRDGVKDAAETLVLREGAAPSGFKITEASGQNALTFTPTSVGSTAGQWTICRATPEVHLQQRQLNVGATGRPAIKKITGTTCT